MRIPEDATNPHGWKPLRASYLEQPSVHLSRTGGRNRTGLEPALVGRDAELALLREALGRRRRAVEGY